MLCLLQQKVPTKEDIDCGTRLLNRLYPPKLPESTDDDLSQDNDICVSNTNENDLEKEINAAINNAAKEGIKKSFCSLREEFLIFKKTGERTAILQQLCEAILTVRPTSTEPERVFSTSANFSRKLRSRLSDHSLNCLVFLKYYRINK